MNWNTSTATISALVAVLGLQLGLAAQAITLYSRLATVETKIDTLTLDEVEQVKVLNRLAIMETRLEIMGATCNGTSGGQISERSQSRP